MIIVIDIPLNIKQRDVRVRYFNGKETRDEGEILYIFLVSGNVR